MSTKAREDLQAFICTVGLIATLILANLAAIYA